ncbi:MAG: threonylcarbamoyl-AMP synthase [Selenomonadaceae bacterium]|nr:threonylcarbamoyl-AMP synthase [Selenomonadaceae bacterium]
MKTEILKPIRENIRRAGKLIRAGELVAFPTETVYGLGADGLNAMACRKIFAAKGRPSDNPLILHFSHLSKVEQAAKILPAAEKLFAAFCPGPLTIILPKTKFVPDDVTGGLSTVGVRFPDNDVARAFIKAADCPIAAPSANLSGRPSPTTPQAVYNDLRGKIEIILDGGACQFGVESTIVDVTCEVPEILRPGAITKEMLEEILGEVKVAPTITDKPRAPGMKYTHYAPKVPLTLIESSDDKIFRREIKNLRAENKIVGVMSSQELISKLDEEKIIPVTYGRRSDLKSIAANLYESLRNFDDLPAQIILAEGVEDFGLGVAIMNRLRKAATFILRD